MKKTIFLLFIIFSTSTFGSINEKFILSKEEKEFIKKTTIDVTISKDWKPFAFMSNANQPTGVSTEVWELLSKKLNLKTNYTFFDNFTEQLNSIKTKQQDVIFSTGKTADREEYAIFTRPYISFPLSIVTLKANSKIESLDKIIDKKIAVGKNFTAHKILKEIYPKKEFILVSSIEKGLRAVEDNKAFAYIDIKPNLTYNIEKLALKSLTIAKDTQLNFYLRIMIRDDYKLLQSAINKTIATLDEQEIKNILSKWDNIHFEDTFNYKLFWIILSIIFALMAFLVYLNQLNIKQNRVLKEKVEERTKELKELNKSLEKKVEEKTKELKRTNYLLDEAQKMAQLGSFQYNLLKDKLVFSEELYKILDLNKDKTIPTRELLLSFVHDNSKHIIKNHLSETISINKTTIDEFQIASNKNINKYLQINSRIRKKDKDNKPIMIVGTILDITKIKQLEIEKREQDNLLAQQSKMAAMGEMLENIAHQWRQPLSVISTAATGMQLGFELQKDVSRKVILDNIQTINEHTQYLSKTIDDFRNFFNPNKEKTTFNIVSCINKTLYLIKSKLTSSYITLNKNIEDVIVTTIESELTQILLNILNNAIDALNHNKNDDKQILIVVKQNNTNISIEIKDSAGGVPEKIKNRVFEPYFTTKHKAQGTGIGLYMSSQIITKHLHGEIKLSNEEFLIENKKYYGANFKIIFPTKTL